MSVFKRKQKSNILKRKSNVLKLTLLTSIAVLSVGAISTSTGSSGIIEKSGSSTQAATDAETTKDKTYIENVNVVDNTKLIISPDDMSSTTSSGTTSYDTDKVELNASSIIQSTAYDQNTNSGYASFVTYDGQSAVAKFLGSNTTNNSTVQYAGQTQWVVTSDDLIKAAMRGINGSTISDTSGYTLVFKAMLYSLGGNDVNSSLFVIASINHSGTCYSCLFQINWGYYKTSTETISAGDYRLAAVLSSGTSSSFIDYNFLVMEAVSTHTMQVFYLPELTSSSTYSGYYVTVSNAMFKAEDSSSSASAAANTLTISSDDTSQYFTTDKKYLPIYAQRINSRFFFIFQNEDGTVDSKSLVFVRSDQLTDSTSDSNLTITGNSNFRDLDLSSTGIVSSQLFKTNIYYNSQESTSVANINLLLSFPGNSSYVYTKFDVISFSYTTDVTVYTGYSSGGFIRQVIPYYTINSTSISGYYALTSTNQVVQLDADFNYVEVLYDFNSSIYKLGNIYQIYTLSGSNSGIWYAQMTDGTFAKMSYSTLVGQWDKLNQNSSVEKVADFTILSQDEVDSSAFFRKVVNDNGNGFDSSFVSFIEGTSSWELFLTYDPNSVDGQLSSSKDLSVSVSIYNYSNASSYYFGDDAIEKLTNDGPNSLTLIFAQNLRTIDSNGNIDYDSTTSVIIGSYTYTFYYGVATINGESAQTISYNSYSDFTNQTGLTIPQYVLNMYPTQVVNMINETSSESSSNFISLLLNMNNIVSPTITATGNDTTGVLTVVVTVPYIWSTTTAVAQNAIWTFTFGSSSSPFFNYNPFGFTDSTGTTSNASVTAIDSTFAADSTNADTIATLTSKYSTLLPSEVSKEDYYNDFLVLGSAFSNETYIRDGLIVLPTTDVDQYITVVPDDANGSAFVSITFPKIGPDENYTVNFTTPSIFMTDASASQSVYFAWKTSDLTTYNGSDINQTLPSTVANDFTNATTTSTNTIALLKNFAVFSDYYANLINQDEISVISYYDDSQGFISIVLKIADGVSISGLNTNVLSVTYTGFKADSSSTSTNITSSTQTSNFAFGTYTADSSVSPSSITQSDLLSSSLLNGNSNLSDWINSGLATLTLTPSNATGTLKVSVTLLNYKSSDSSSIVASQTFTINIGGFASTNQNADMIVWKTNTDTNLNGKLPTDLVETATSGEYADSIANVYYSRLKYFANISTDLDAKLSEDPSLVTNFTMQADDDAGTLTVSAVILINGVSTVYSNTITGLATSSTLQPSIVFNVSDTTSSSTTATTALQQLREMLPSQVTSDNANLLNLFTIYSSSDNYVTNITLEYDDYGGSLSVTVTITDPSSDVILATASQTFTGFQQATVTSAGTNWGVVAACIVVPFVVLLVPVLLYGYVEQRKDMRAIAKRLSERLKEEQDRERRMKRRLQMNRQIKKSNL